MRIQLLLASSLLATACATGSGGTNETGVPPRDGMAILQRMHERYAGRWFRSLTFVQKTVARRPDGTEQVSTWYEAQRGSRLRIDMGDPSAGNGALYTADSLYVIRAGKVARTVAEGHPFLPLIVGVYTPTNGGALVGRATLGADDGSVASPPPNG